MALQDFLSVLRGVQKVVDAGLKLQEKQIKQIVKNSSLALPIPPTSKLPVLSLTEAFDKLGVLVEGVKNYVATPNMNQGPARQDVILNDEDEIAELNKQFNQTFADLERLRKNAAKANTVSLTTQSASASIKPASFPQLNPDIEAKMLADSYTNPDTIERDVIAVKPATKKKAKQTLSASSKARVVPASRIARVYSFGSLAAGLGVGTLAQYAKNAFNSVTGSKIEEDEVLLTTANAERIVNTLCKVRGAALKIGQLLSIQDETVISPELQKIFERVRQSADFMPFWQVEKVLISQLGSDWRSKLKSFDEKPFAAASIGQVHYGVLQDGTEIAMKIQYPGVAKGINSDIDNLFAVLNIWNIFPKGMFIENIVEVAKKELSWEVNYIREAECTKLFKKLLVPYPEYYVPFVVDELSTAEVITSELVEGLPLDKCFDMDYETKHYIASKIMLLVLREMFILKTMQTDPNWSNFFYNPNTKKIILLDFGATRYYSKEFMDQYIEIIKSAADGNRDKILQLSKKMKFLTGYETKVMEETHIDTVMIMGEVFNTDDPRGFDFGTQQTTKRIQNLVPTILTHRLCPPPEEIYSLHRKLTGVFLLCSKMKVRLNCYEMFNDIYTQYKSSS